MEILFWKFPLSPPGGREHNSWPLSHLWKTLFPMWSLFWLQFQFCHKTFVCFSQFWHTQILFTELSSFVWSLPFNPKSTSNRNGYDFQLHQFGAQLGATRIGVQFASSLWTTSGNLSAHQWHVRLGVFCIISHLLMDTFLNSGQMLNCYGSAFHGKLRRTMSIFNLFGKSA